MKYECKQCGNLYESKSQAWVCCSSYDEIFRCRICGREFIDINSVMHCPCNEPSTQYQLMLWNEMKGGLNNDLQFIM